MYHIEEGSSISILINLSFKASKHISPILTLWDFDMTGVVTVWVKERVTQNVQTVDLAWFGYRCTAIISYTIFL